MATIKALLYKSKQKSDGKYSIAIRVTKDRKPKYYFIEWIEEKYWDEENKKVKSSHPNWRRLNNTINKKIAEADDLILEFEGKKKYFTTSDIIDLMKGKKKTYSFFQLAEEHIAQLKKMNKINRAVSDNSKINSFKEFVQNDQLQFDDITEHLLKMYKAYLIAKGTNSERSIMNIFILIRLLFNRAIKMGIIDRQRYPFGEDKIRIVLPDSMKIGLDEEEIKKIESLELIPGSPIAHTRNVFLFSFYLAGIRISDVLKMKWKDIKDGRLYYRMGKNNKITSLKIPDNVARILDIYKERFKNNNDYIFPELRKADTKNENDVYSKTKTAIKKFNKYLGEIAKLAEIDKKITTHIARHSFGNIAGDKISPQMLQKLYRHSNLSTTIGYQGNFIHKDADEALDSVLNF